MKKISFLYNIGMGILLFIIAIETGCILPGLDHSSLVTQTVTPPSYAPKDCPLPIFVLNYSENITKLDHGLTIIDPNGNPITGTGGYPIPSGSIIHHFPNYITRIFDSNGTQILIVKDTESYLTTEIGNQAATYYFPQLPPLRVIGEGENITYYVNDTDLLHPCVITVIYDPEVSSPFEPQIPF